MRRLVLVFMLFLLPFQWSWAAAGSVCGHEAGGSHFGHHQHEHPASHADEADDGSDPFGSHPDCDACHGLCAAMVPSFAEAGTAWAGELHTPAYGRFLPDPPVSNLLRPPLALVA